MTFHPLYETYEHILNEELPMYENIQSIREASDFMDFHLGILTTQYQAKIKGVRAGFDST